MSSFIEDLPSNNWFSIKIVFLATLTAISSGTVLFINALVAPDLQCEWGLTTFEVTSISIAFYGGEAFGSWYWGRIADIYGRKNTLIASTGSMLYFVLLSAASRSFHLYLLLRFFVGAGFAGSFLLTVIYNTEFTKSTDHGKALFWYNLVFTFGSLFSISFSYWTLNNYGWRIYTIAVISPAIILLYFMIAYLPESIRFLQSQGRTSEALEVIKDACKTTKTALTKDMDLLNMNSDTPSKTEDSRYFQVLSKHWINIFGLSFYGVPMFLSFYGLPFFIEYKLQHATCTLIVNETISPKCVPLTDGEILRSFFINLGYLPGAFIGYFMAEKIGRKILLNTTTGLLAVCYISQLICLPNAINYFLLFLSSGMSLSAGCFIVLYAAELFPTNVRMTSTGIASAVWKFCSIFSPVLFQHLIYTNTTFVIVLMSAWSIVGAFGLCPLPETLGHGLKEF